MKFFEETASIRRQISGQKDVPEYAVKWDSMAISRNCFSWAIRRQNYGQENGKACKHKGLRGIFVEMIILRKLTVNSRYSRKLEQDTLFEKEGAKNIFIPVQERWTQIAG